MLYWSLPDHLVLVYIDNIPYILSVLCLQACQTHTVCCIVDSSLASAALVTNHFTGHRRQAAAHFEAAWSLLSDSFSVLQDSLDLCKW